MKYGILLLLFWLLMAGCTSPSANAAPVPAIDTGIDPQSWVKIPAGDFLSGPHNQMTALDAGYETMVTDVTNEQYAHYLNEALAAGKVKLVDGPQGQQVVGFYPGDTFRGVKHEMEIQAGDWLHVPVYDSGLRIHIDGQNFTAKPGYQNHPMVLVTWFGAKAYCDFYGWRLPAELEWEKAARGTDGRAYPWGSEIRPENANYYSSHDIFEKIFGKLGDTTPVGFYNGKTYGKYATLDSPSPYGLYDMAGDVWQWVADIFEGTHYRYLRGGGKADYEYNLRVWTRNSAGPDYASPNVGFRCARTKQ
jgi:formylglycine-generating enzyme required for sulfatase activity